jgi:fumarate hydratase subunit beta
MKEIILPLTLEKIKVLRCGDEAVLTGKIYTARDQAHKRLMEVIAHDRPLPIDLRNTVIYYCGPAKTPPGKSIGSCGPTTSSRMDAFTPALLQAGLKGMIGKGRRSEEVITAIKKYNAVYFLTYAGCGALLSGYVRKARLVAYKELGPEALYELEVKDFPVIVAVDAKGNNIYNTTD